MMGCGFNSSELKHLVRGSKLVPGADARARSDAQKSASLVQLFGDISVGDVSIDDTWSLLMTSSHHFEMSDAVSVLIFCPESSDISTPMRRFQS